jgi:hypothetical protein
MLQRPEKQEEYPRAALRSPHRATSKTEFANLDTRPLRCQPDCAIFAVNSQSKLAER